MARIMKTCRVCGKDYEACRTVSKAVGVFRWQDVACSPECGAVYLRRINESRGLVEAPVASNAVAEPTSVEHEAVFEPTKRSKHNKQFQRSQLVQAPVETPTEEATDTE